MIKINKFEGKTLEEAKNKALTELNANEKELFIKEEFVEGKLFKSSKYILDVIEVNEVKQFLKNYFSQLGKLMNINIESEIRIHENSFNIMLVSSNNAALIGKEGKTIDSIQTIIRQVILNETNMNLKINVDVSNYKEKKLKKLEYEIKKIAKEVLATKIDASLDPMNSYERRNIHNMIDSWKNLTTESVGEGKERHIIIKYVEEK